MKLQGKKSNIEIISWSSNNNFRYFAENVITWFTAEFRGSKAWKFTNNNAPNDFEDEAADFGMKVEELNY